ncbi:hypothetical protein PG994_004329 [Apiospora phragmitis]|uniref:Uncharacterized protein n=1 Tax=Apiospora phragmitis TaxID=2905665 RepID=A0ABR1VTD5_9PEZI
MRRRAQTRLNTRAYRKRKALAKIAEEASNAGSEPLIKSEVLVQCWDAEQQSVFIVPTYRTKQLYNARDPLLPLDNAREQRHIVFPLSPDHLITLLQFNVLRALAANRTLISGVLATPLDCSEETIHLLSYPTGGRVLPLSLLPTLLQQTARDRMIRAAGTFDEDALWADCVGGLYEGFPDDEVERRGIIAWSPPWDIAGWELSEGFVRKWSWLFVEMLPRALEATNRWRMERGEEPFDHDMICRSRTAG